MLRDRYPTLAVLVAMTLAARAAAQELVVDTAGAGALMDQALHHSQIMPNLAYLTDVIGARLTGAPTAHQANEWTLSRFRAYGRQGHLEPVGAKARQGPLIRL